MISARGIQFGYNRKRLVLKDVSLDLAPGRIYGLLGKNGEGKTTLLKLICGLRYPAGGTLGVLGQNPSLRPVALLQDICLLPEEVPMHQATAAQLERLRAPLYPRFNGSDHAALLKEFDVGADMPLTQLSHGQRKKAALAFALATNCRILLLDEPTNGLDIPSKSVFRRLVARALDPTRCIVISTHQVRDVEDLIDTVAILEGGTIVLNTPLADAGEKLAVVSEPGSRRVLYAEENAAGRRCVVVQDSSGGVERLDLELLFNAAISSSREISAALEQGRNS